MDSLYSLSLCTGIGALDLGVRAALGVRPVCYVERDAYCQRVLAARIADGGLPDAPVWGDLTTFDGARWAGAVDFVVAGAPCQPFSTASRGRRVAVSLIDAVERTFFHCGANCLLVENVVGAGFALDALRVRLLRRGFCAPPVAENSSASVGAPHDRRRLWLLAHPHGEGERLRALYAKVAGLCAAGLLPSIGDWRRADLARAALRRVDDGAAGGMERQRALGNAVVPAQVVHALGLLLGASC